MVDTYKKLAQVELTGSPTDDTLYTVPASTEAIIKHIRVVNSTAGDVTIKLWHDGTADSNLILPDATILAGGWAEFDGLILMEAADTLVATTDTTSAVTVTVYGLEIS